MFIDPNVKHHFSAGMYAKEMRIPAGGVIVSHKHKYDHLSILASGKVMLTIDGNCLIPLTAPACIDIAAGTHHKITAIEDSVWFCIHATAITDAERIDETLTDEPDMNQVVRLVTEEN
jgi:quercetin dioxygenase-like cupin family protein